MRCAEISAGHKQIIHCLGVKTAKRNLKWAKLIDMGVCAILIEDTFRRMIIIADTCIHDIIIEASLSIDIVLGKDVVANEATVFPSTRHQANPFQIIILQLFLNSGAIFHIIPNCVGYMTQLHVDFLHIGDAVFYSAPFKPPKSGQ